MSTVNIVEIVDFTKIINEQSILDHVNATFEISKIHGIIGNNGSGKSMLFKAICGFVRPTSGYVKVHGKIIGHEIDCADDVGAIIESPGFLPMRSGISNLFLLSRIRNIIDKSQIASIMQTVGLDPSERKRVGKYSMGMRQRLGIAQAIMEDTSLIILDEPMNNLDKHGVADMRKLFLRLRDEGKTILLASHNAADIEALCDTVHEMDAGVLSPWVPTATQRR